MTSLIEATQGANTALWLLLVVSVLACVTVCLGLLAVQGVLLRIAVALEKLASAYSRDEYL